MSNFKFAIHFSIISFVSKTKVFEPLFCQCLIKRQRQWALRVCFFLRMVCNIKNNWNFDPYEKHLQILPLRLKECWANTSSNVFKWKWGGRVGLFSRTAWCSKPSLIFNKRIWFSPYCEHCANEWILSLPRWLLLSSICVRRIGRWCQISEENFAVFHWNLPNTPWLNSEGNFLYESSSILPLLKRGWLLLWKLSLIFAVAVAMMGTLICSTRLALFMRLLFNFLWLCHLIKLLLCSQLTQKFQR